MSLDNQEISNLTLIIPTFERQDYLLRQILYLADWNVKTIIVDGSLNKITNVTQKVIDQNTNISYYHLNKSYVERVYFAANKIKTEFAMCLAEDDFYLRSGIEQSIKILKLNTDAVACMGKSIGLDRLINKNYVFEYGNNLTDYNINQDLAKSRIAFAFNQYRSAAPYAVYKASTFKKVWSLRDKVSCLEVVEYENTLNTLLEGKLISSNSLYWIRSFETSPIPSKLDGTRKTDFNAWYSKNRFSIEKERFETRVKNSFINQLKLSNVDSELFYKEILNNIISRSQSTLVVGNKRSLIFDIILKKLRFSFLLLNLKNLLIWKKYFRPIITYWLRDKIKYSKLEFKLKESEIKKVIRFANATRNIVKK